MSNVVSLNDYRQCELLGSVNIYEQPNGEITLGVTYMDPRQIERVDTIADRFRLLSRWLIEGSPSLEEQAVSFEETTDVY